MKTVSQITAPLLWICLLAQCGCGERVEDLSSRPGFDQLIGACFELKTTLVVRPFREGGQFDFFLSSQVPTDDRLSSGWIEREGSRVFVNQIRLIHGFDRLYLEFGGRFGQDESASPDVLLNELLDLDWELKVLRMIREGRDLESDDLELVFNPQLARSCTT